MFRPSCYKGNCGLIYYSQNNTNPISVILVSYVHMYKLYPERVICQILDNYYNMLCPYTDVVLLSTLASLLVDRLLVLLSCVLVYVVVQCNCCYRVTFAVP